MHHGSNDLNVHDISEFSGLLKVIEAMRLHELPGDLIGYLISPLVDYRHVDVVYKDGHLSTGRRSVCRTWSKIVRISNLPASRPTQCTLTINTVT